MVLARDEVGAPPPSKASLALGPSPHHTHLILNVGRGTHLAKHVPIAFASAVVLAGTIARTFLASTTGAVAVAAEACLYPCLPKQIVPFGAVDCRIVLSPSKEACGKGLRYRRSSSLLEKVIARLNDVFAEELMQNSAKVFKRE